MENLEEGVEKAFKELGINGEKKKAIGGQLSIIKNKDEDTYYHSLRVGLRMKEVSKFMHLNPVSPYIAGLLHDIGKIAIDAETLKKKEGFDEKDMKEMENHPIFSFNIIKDIDLYAAYIAEGSHMNQGGRSYPKNLPKPNLPPEAGSEVMLDYFRRLLGFIDSYDAMTTRPNDRFGKKGPLTTKEARDNLLKGARTLFVNRYRWGDLVKELFSKEILGKPEGEEGIAETVKKALWEDAYMRRAPEQAKKYATMACALRPIPYSGKKKEKMKAEFQERFESFMNGEIKVGERFEELAKRVQKANGQPKVIYDEANKALVDTEKIKKDWRINHGLIEMLVPIVTAQMLFDRYKLMETPMLLARATEVIRNTSEDDVAQLLAMKRIAYDLEGQKDKEVPKYEVKNVFEYYSEAKEKASSPLTRQLSEEVVEGFPIVKYACNHILRGRRKTLMGKIDATYNSIKRNKKKAPSTIANCVSAALYILLSNGQVEIIG